MCHCEAHGAEAISCLMNRRRLVTPEIALALRLSQ
jgi:hypothetical protein